jgi:hypothetical protein
VVAEGRGRELIIHAPKQTLSRSLRHEKRCITIIKRRSRSSPSYRRRGLPRSKQSRPCIPSIVGVGAFACSLCRLGLDHDLSRPRDGNVDLRQRQRLSKMFDDGGVHETRPELLPTENTRGLLWTEPTKATRMSTNALLPLLAARAGDLRADPLTPPLRGVRRGN